MTQLLWVIVAFLASGFATGFITGVLMSKSVFNEARALRMVAQASFDNVKADMRSVHDRLVALESAAKSDISKLVN